MVINADNRRVDDPAQLIRFYDKAYSTPPDEAARSGRWRALGAVGKADHVLALCQRAGLRPRAVVEVGCGDGALLSELHRRGLGVTLAGFEITDAATALARQRPEIDMVQTFDGKHLPVAEGTYDLGILSHVLEHVPDPAALLAEVGRACRAVVIEVPLEANLSAARSSKRKGAVEVGHLQRFDRAAVAAVVEQAGMGIVGELDDPLPRAMHRFFAATAPERLRADAKWALRSSLARGAPALARRLFTVHHACLCVAETAAGAGDDDTAP